jgi:GT2 family glycosyltransferase
VDNASPNESEMMLRKHLPDIRIYQTGFNLGYTGGVNFGMRKVLDENTAYILILNPDTLVEPEFLEVMVESMEEHPSAAASCGTIYYHPNRDRIWYAGGRMVPWRGLAIHNHVLPTKAGNLKGKPQSVSFITGCMVLLRTSAIREIGFQDERFFMYLDDIEYSARVLSKGFTLLYVPQAKIFHRIDEKMELSPFMVYYSVRNRLLLINTIFYGWTRKIARIYFIIVIICKLIVWRFLKPQFFKTALAGLSDYFTNNLGEGRGVREFST